MFSLMHRLWGNSSTLLVAALLLISSLGVTPKALAQAGNISDDAITLTVQPTGQGSASSNNYAGSANSSTYKSYPSLGRPNNSSISPPQLGTYDLGGNSVLMLTQAMLGGTITTENTSVTVARTQYRVYLVGTAEAMKPSYATFTMSSSQKQISTDPPISTFTGTGTNSSVNLLLGLNSGGTYVLDVRFQADITNGSNTEYLNDSQSGGYYFANFYVTPPATTPAGGTTTWQGTINTDWTNPSNWTNGVPTASSNAIIPENTESTNIIFPVLNNLAYHYIVNDLTLQGNTSSGKAQVTIQNAVLHVYGNLSQLTGGLVGAFTNNTGVADSTNNSTLILAGANQFVTGRLSVPDIIIAGSGIKSVANTMLPTNTLSFRPKDAVAGVIVQSAGPKTNADGSTSYVFDTTGNSLISLGSTGQINANAGSNETNTSYVKGILAASAQFVATKTSYLGNMGLDILPNHSAANIVAYRTIGDPLIGPTTPSSGKTPVPIKRQYQIVGDDNTSAAATSSSLNTITFHYLPSAYELNGIMESNLAMFRTTTGSAPYTPVAGTLDTNTHTLTRTDLETFSNFYLTLGDKTNPLPVSLTVFTATRSNTNAVLAWTTASELDNTGFEVQVSSDGVTFRKLAFVASQNPNSVQVLNYNYADTENGKTGIRYYRLRQIDVSGEEAFSPVRAVSFSSTMLASTGLAAYPNPFVDKLDFNLDATTVGSGVAHVQLVDMTGRMVREQNISVANASLSLDGLSSLGSGLYMAKVTLPDGTSQTVRIQKQ